MPVFETYDGKVKQLTLEQLTLAPVARERKLQRFVEDNLHRRGQFVATEFAPPKVMTVRSTPSGFSQAEQTLPRIEPRDA